MTADALKPLLREVDALLAQKPGPALQEDLLKIRAMVESKMRLWSEER